METVNLVNGDMVHNDDSQPVRKQGNISIESGLKPRTTRFSVEPVRPAEPAYADETDETEKDTEVKETSLSGHSLKSALHLPLGHSHSRTDLSSAQRTRFRDSIRVIKTSESEDVSQAESSGAGLNQSDGSDRGPTDGTRLLLRDEEATTPAEKKVSTDSRQLHGDRATRLADKKVSTDGRLLHQNGTVTERKVSTTDMQNGTKPGTTTKETKESKDKAKQQEEERMSMKEIWMSLQYQMVINQKQIRRNFMLFILVGCLFTGITVFAVNRPASKDAYEMDLTGFAVFWPLERRLVLRHPKYPNLPQFEISWGYRASPADGSLPSYCVGTKEGMDCTDGDCCLNYPDQSKLTIEKLPISENLPNNHAGCVSVQWTYERGTMISSWIELVDDYAEFADCFFTNTALRKWYGGSILTTTIGWPRSWINTTFNPALTGDPENAIPENDNHLGVMEPFWVSSDGYAIFVESPSLLYVNSTADYFCIRSADEMRYIVCEADNMKDLYGVLQEDLQNSPEGQTNRPNETAFLKKIEQVAGRIFVIVNVTSFDLSNAEETTGQAEQLGYLWRNLPSSVAQKLVLSLENTDVFDDELTQLSVAFVNSLRVNNSLSNLTVSVELSNFLNLETLQNNRSIWSTLIKQRDKTGVQSTGLVLWRNEYRPVLDLTESNVTDWFVDYCENHWELYRVANFAIAAGGAGELLPVSPYLNGSSPIDPNLNVYSQQFINSIYRLDKWSLAAVAFRTQLMPYFIDIPVKCANYRSVIPVALSLSLFGYSFLSVKLTDIYTTSCSESTAELLLSLAMFFPVIRIPIEYLQAERTGINGSLVPSQGLLAFNRTLMMYEKIRNGIILPFYEEAFQRHPTKPVIRPMWWESASKLDFPTRETALEISNQYMIGHDLVVVAFLDTSRFVYLPVGLWYNPLDQSCVDSDGQHQIYYQTKMNVTCFMRTNSTVSNCSPI